MKRTLAICAALSACGYGQSVLWKKSFWAKDNPFTVSTENFTQAQSGEDWAMKVIPSKDNSGKIDGFVVAGFNDFQNYMPRNQNSCSWVPGFRRWTVDGLPGGALTLAHCPSWEAGTDSTLSTTHRKGVAWASISKYTESGSEVWTKVYGFPGAFESIIQTSDGGYLAVGVAEGMRDFKNDAPLAYNPIAGVPNKYFEPSNYSGGELTTCKTATFEKWLAVKTDRDGAVTWSYIYGVPAYTSNGYAALLPKGWAYAVIEMDNGKFLIGGEQSDPDYSTTANKRAAIIQIDANGKYEWGEYYATTVGGGSIQDFQKATVSGNSVYLAAGMEGYSDGTSPHGYRRKAFLAKVDVAGFHLDDEGAFSWIQYHGYEPSVKENMRVTDIAVNTAGNVLLPVIRRTGSYCFSWNCRGDATMYIADPSDGDLITSIDLTDYNNSGDNFKAYDLRLGVTPTFDGGFAIVSSVQPNGELVWGTDVPNTICGGGLSPDSTSELRYFETDAYVAKYSKSGAKLWGTSFDSNTESPSGSRYGWSYPHSGMLDLKREECVYSIIETSVRTSFIIVGNNSANFDDFYFAKINSINIVPYVGPLLD